MCHSISGHRQSHGDGKSIGGYQGQWREGVGTYALAYAIPVEDDENVLETSHGGCAVL